MTLRFGLPHGIACSFTLPMVLERAIGVDPDATPCLEASSTTTYATRRGAWLNFSSASACNEFAAYGVTDDDSRRMVAQAMDGVRGKNFIGAR